MPKLKKTPTLQDELRAWVKLPIDPDLRKLLRKTIKALNTLHSVGLVEPTPELPSLAERIENASEQS